MAGIYDVGLPSIIMQSISSVMNFGMNKILIGFSETAVSVLGVYFKLQSFVFMPGFGLTNALVPIVGYNYGARRKERILSAIKVCMVAMFCVMALGTVIFQLFPGQLLAMFSDGGDLGRIGQPALRIISLSFLFAGVDIVFSSLFQAVGEGLLSLLMSAFRQLVLLLPVAWLLSLTGNLDAVWYSFFIAEVCALVLATLSSAAPTRTKSSGWRPSNSNKRKTQKPPAHGAPCAGGFLFVLIQLRFSFSSASSRAREIWSGQEVERGPQVVPRMRRMASAASMPTSRLLTPFRLPLQPPTTSML